MRARRQVADWTLVALALALSVYGIAMVFSAGQTDAPTMVARIWRTQLMWCVLGIGAAWLTTRASVRLLEWASVPVYALSTALLFLLLFVGTGAGTAASTKSWLAIGGVRLGQPSELAKLAVVLCLAKVLSSRKDAPKSLFELWPPVVVVLVPWLLIMGQPDLGTAIVFIGILFAMLFWSGVSWPLLVLLASPAVSLVLAFSTGLWGAWFILLIALVLWARPYLLEGALVVAANVAMGVVAPLLWEQLQPYQQRRLQVFLDPQADPRASGYHVIQSQVAIGSGGWFGKGFTLGTQKRLAFLPAQHTDFIFPVVGEELGFLGVSVALILFTWLLLRSTRVAGRAPSAFPSLVAFGLMASWFVHILVNVGMTLNLMPITGIPLPFFSYGGSFMLSCWLAVGMLVRISSEGRGKADTLVI
ncbi:MAG: rod shape-determining protein RodA [Gemmatimonadaceae bacterium]|nr:rod shape-determining protein RodA [Gemmatimonadaceae bacterium]